jgi:hypothetical protein
MDGLCTVCGASWDCEHQDEAERGALQSLPSDTNPEVRSTEDAIAAIERLNALRNDPSSSASQASLGFHDTPWIDVQEPF